MSDLHVLKVSLKRVQNEAGSLVDLLGGDDCFFFAYYVAL